MTFKNCSSCNTPPDAMDMSPIFFIKCPTCGKRSNDIVSPSMQYDEETRDRLIADWNATN